MQFSSQCESVFSLFFFLLLRTASCYTVCFACFIWWCLVVVASISISCLHKRTSCAPATFCFHRHTNTCHSLTTMTHVWRRRCSRCCLTFRFQVPEPILPPATLSLTILSHYTTARMHFCTSASPDSVHSLCTSSNVCSFVVTRTVHSHLRPFVVACEKPLLGSRLFLFPLLLTEPQVLFRWMQVSTNCLIRVTLIDKTLYAFTLSLRNLHPLFAFFSTLQDISFSFRSLDPKYWLGLLHQIKGFLL